MQQVKCYNIRPDILFRTNIIFERTKHKSFSCAVGQFKFYTDSMGYTSKPANLRKLSLEIQKQYIKIHIQYK